MREQNKISHSHVFSVWFHDPPLGSRAFVYLIGVAVVGDQDLILHAQEKQVPGDHDDPSARMRVSYFQIKDRVETLLASPPSAQQVAQPPV